MADEIERVKIRGGEQRTPDTSLAWKDASLEDVGPAAYRAARHVYRQQSGRQVALARYDILYDGIQQEGGFAGSSMANYIKSELTPEGKPKLSLNVTRAVVDTAQAKVTGMEVRPQYLTSGGNWQEQQQARQLERFSDGQAHATGMRELGPEVFRDGLVADIGGALTFAEDDEVCTERVPPSEILVDADDGRYGRPYQLFRWKWVPREALLSNPRFEASLDKIKASRADAWDNSVRVDSDGDRLLTHVVVVEAWHRPFSKGGQGRHVICLENCTLFQEAWTRDRFPLSVVRYSRPRRGYYGRGMVAHLRGNQRQINHLLQTIIEISQHTVPQVWLEEGNQAAKGQMTNEIMALRTYIGREPVFSPGVSVHASLWEQVDRIYRGSFDQEGVSQMDAHGEKPPGVDAGVAIREYRDIGTERFSVASKGYEAFRLDVSEEQVECGRAIAKRNRKFSVLVPGPKFSERLEFSKVDLARDKYVLQVFPASSLPKEPTGRLAMISDLLKNGMLGATDGKRLLGFPDLDASTSLELAPFESVLAEVSRIEMGEEFRGPVPFMNLDFAAKVGQWSWCRAYTHGAPESVLEDLQLWTEQALAMVKQFGGAAAAPGQADAGMGQALGKPAAPPTGDLQAMATAAPPAPGAAA